MRQVLDHGYVRLVDSMGDDLSVVRAARVSYAGDTKTGQSPARDEKLLRYLWENRHTTPFEAVTFTFEVKAPIFVVRQWHRHRTWSYNEVSARYTALPSEFYIPDPGVVGVQSVANKQQRTVDGDVDREAMLATKANVRSMASACQFAVLTYERLLAAGMPRELARAVLPSATYTRMYATANLLNVLKFIELRDHPHAQYEIRQYATALFDLMSEKVPTVCAVIRDARDATPVEGKENA